MSRVRRHRRGNAAVVALSLTALLAFGALSVDVAMQRVVNAQIQAAAEAGVLAGAGYLDRTASALTLSQQKAVEFANMNAVPGWQLTEAEVEVGTYVEGVFTPIDPTGLTVEDPIVREVNAIRVMTTHSISAVLGRALNVQTLKTNNEAIAVREADRGSARSVPCVLPLAIPDCDYTGYLDGSNTSGVNPAPIRFQMTDDTNDSIGWANQFTENYGSQDIIESLAGGGCNDDDLEIDEDVYVKNGQNTAVLHFLGDVFNNSSTVVPDTWDTNIAPRPDRDGLEANCPRGQQLNASQVCETPGGNPNIGSAITDSNWAQGPVIQGPVALIKPDNCADIKFNGWHDVSGFAWAMIYDVEDSANQKNVWIQLDFVNEHDFGGDIDDEGNGNITGLEKPRLVVL